MNLLVGIFTDTTLTVQVQIIDHIQIVYTSGIVIDALYHFISAMENFSGLVFFLAISLFYGYSRDICG